MRLLIEACEEAKATRKVNETKGMYLCKGGSTGVADQSSKPNRRSGALGQGCVCVTRATLRNDFNDERGRLGEERLGFRPGGRGLCRRDDCGHKVRAPFGTMAITEGRSAKHVMRPAITAAAETEERE